MSYEELYEALVQDIAKIEADLKRGWGTPTHGKDDLIARRHANTYGIYADVNAPTNFLGTIDKFIANKALYHFFIYDTIDAQGRRTLCVTKFSSLQEFYQEIIKKLYETFTADAGYSKQMLKDIIKEIANTGIYTTYNIVDKNNNYVIKLYTPEEKLIAVDTLKAIIATLELKDTWYKKCTRVLQDSKYSKADLEAILKGLK